MLLLYIITTLSQPVFYCQIGRKKEHRSAVFFSSFSLVRCVGQKRYVTGSLNSYCESSLMSCTGSCDSSGKNFSSLRDVSLKCCSIFVGNLFALVSAEKANLLSSANDASSCGSFRSFLISLYRFIFSHFAYLLFDLVERQLIFHCFGNVHKAVA